MLKTGYVKRSSIFHEGYRSCIYHFIRNDTEIGHFRIDYLDDCYWMWDFYINFPYRNCGYGDKMLQECIKTLNDKPLKCYGFNTEGHMLHLLKKYNFIIIKVEDLRNVCRYQMRREVK